MISFIIAFFSIIVLAALHELGHFLIAKKCGVKVEEFGIGYPPRIFGKKIGETLYSINILPLGAFVKMEGEEESIDKSSSFSNQSIKNKVLITSGGVLSFWLIAIMIFSFILYLGYGTIVDDNDYSNLSDFKVRILEVVELSPAEEADLKMGDTIRRMSFGEESISPLKIKDIQFFVSTHLGEKIDILIERGDDEIERSLIIRDSFPEEEGAMGVALIRTAVEKYPWYAAIFQGIVRTWDGTIMVLNGYGSMISNFFRGVSSEGGIVGPIGVFQMVAQSQEFGPMYFLSFIALISINLAVFNSLPIPLVDGGRIFFLFIEWIRKKPISQKIQEKIDATSLVFLGVLIVWVMVKDIVNLF